MRKHLLFAAMLTLGAAPVFATQTQATSYAVASDDSEQTLDEAYEALQDSITEAITKIGSLAGAVAEKYPESEVLGSLENTVMELQNMAIEVKGKKQYGMLTIDEIEDYQKTVKAYVAGVSDAMEQAELEAYSVEISQTYMALSGDLYEAMDSIPLNVQNYYYSSFEQLSWDMSSAYMGTMGAESKEIYEAAKEQLDSLATKMEDLIDASTNAGKLVDSINATLKTLDAEIEKVKKDFPECDLTYTEEAKTYWQELVDELAAAPKDEEKVYTAEDIEFYTQNFGYFQEEATNLYANAQMDEFMAQFNEKYYPLNDAIYDYQMNLFDECTHLTEDSLTVYYNALDDLSVELSQMYYVLYGDPISQAEFDKMLARIDEIEKEAKKIYDEALEAENEAVATGINGVSADKVSADKAYTLDGKAVKSLAGKKGIFVVNGKKVILK